MTAISAARLMEVVRFEPVRPENEAAAHQETNYVNHIEA
jgi:hypothetical protein